MKKILFFTVTVLLLITGMQKAYSCATYTYINMNGPAGDISCTGNQYQPNQVKVWLINTSVNRAMYIRYKVDIHSSGSVSIYNAQLVNGVVTATTLVKTITGFNSGESKTDSINGLCVVVFDPGVGSGTSYPGIQMEYIDSDYYEQAALFEVDAPQTGTSYAKVAYTSGPFSNSRVLTLDKNTTLSGMNKVMIIVESSMYNQLPEKIKRYAYDINRTYNCHVIMETVSGGNHTNIKSLLIANQTNLDGAVFIGEIPAAWFEIEKDFNSTIRGYKYWPCDLYYMDLNGTWTDADGNGIYDAHTGHVQPEIFVGRISTARALVSGDLGSEKAGLERYLDKNHKFWMGHTTVKKKFALAYIDEDWVNHSGHRESIQHLYGGAATVDTIGWGNPNFGKADYLNRLANDKYEFIQLSCHTDTTITYMTGGGPTSDSIYKHGTKAIGYNLFACNSCRWTSHYCFGGSYIYNAENSSLVVVGSTKTGSMQGTSFSYFYAPLGQGKTMGESLKQWWVNAHGTTHSISIISWHYGMVILGDPMVNFYHCMNSKCASNITLNAFDTTNPASTHHYIAKDAITVNNYVIPAGKHVIFNAKEVILGPGFECKLGGTFEIINEGCMFNCP